MASHMEREREEDRDVKRENGNILPLIKITSPHGGNAFVQFNMLLKVKHQSWSSTSHMGLFSNAIKMHVNNPECKTLEVQADKCRVPGVCWQLVLRCLQCNWWL